MVYASRYASPLGDMFIAADDMGVTGVWFEGQKYFPRELCPVPERNEPHTAPAEEWLDIYFSGGVPKNLPPLHMEGTPFRREVWDILLTIPYGQTMTYGGIAEIIAARRGISRVSAQAVGGAVGHNPLSVIVPCHRVIGADGSLVGYAGGLELKAALLRLEGHDINLISAACRRGHLAAGCACTHVAP